MISTQRLRQFCFVSVEYQLDLGVEQIKIDIDLFSACKKGCCTSSSECGQMDL